MKWDEEYSATYLKQYAEDASISIVFEEANITSGECVLDLGCGSGFGLKSLKNTHCSLFGIDPSWSMLSYAKKNSQNNISYIQAQAENIPIISNIFDIVISSNTIHFWSNISLSLREIWRILKPKGRLIISEDDWNKNKKSLAFCKDTLINKKYILETISQSGFIISKPILHIKHKKRLAVLTCKRRG